MMPFRAKPNERAEQCAEFYSAIITALKYAAYRYGYALAVHGSLQRDIDLLAVPWRDTAPDAHALATEIQKVTEAIIGTARVRDVDRAVGQPAKKPCGRLAWIFYLTHNDDGPYIDLSVMPLVRDPQQ